MVGGLFTTTTTAKPLAIIDTLNPQHSQAGPVDDGKGEVLPPGVVLTSTKAPAAGVVNGADPRAAAAATDCQCNEVLNPLTNACDCKYGFERYYNSTCLPICPPGTVRSGDTCACDFSSELVNGVCVKKCPCNMVRAANGHCRCVDGFEQINNGSCVVPCGPNQVRDANFKCVCKSGFSYDVYNHCVPTCGVYSTWSGSACVCLDFYVRSNPTTCRQPMCKKGQFIEGRGCVCSPGSYYDSYYEECVATTPSCGDYAYWNGVRCICNQYYVPINTTSPLSHCREPFCNRGYFVQGRGCVCTNANENYDSVTETCRPPISTVCGTHAKPDGFGGCGCDANYVRVDAVNCKEPECANAVFNPLTGCECLAGHVKDVPNGIRCSPVPTTCGTYAVSNGLGGCQCQPVHYIKVDSTNCRVSKCLHGTFNTVQGLCVCDSGFANYNPVEEQCYPVIPTCDSNSQLVNNVCECKTYYIKNANGICVPYPCANGDFSSTLGCTCRDGYTRDTTGQNCIPVTPTCDATSHLVNNVCECNQYYTRNNGVCVPYPCANGNLSATVGCTCRDGYTKDTTGQNCILVPVACGAFAKSDGAGGCVCVTDKYIKISSTECRQPQCLHGKFAPTTGCICDAGYQDYNTATESCRASCNANEHYVGTKCECDNYYYRNQAGVCAPWPCANGNFSATSGCSCDAGFEKDASGQNCRPSCIKSTYNAAKDICDCLPHYYTETKWKCVPPTCRYGNFTDAAGCSCTIGYDFSEATRSCEPKCGTFSQWLNGNCTCLPGHEQQDSNNCKPVDCQNGGVFVPTVGCNCSRSHTPDSNGKCTVSVCPPTATWNNTAGCVCPGDRVVYSNQCVPCGDNTKLVAQKCECLPNYEKVTDISCAPITCDNGFFNPQTKKCDCTYWFTPDASGRCTVPRTCPTGSKWNDASKKCLCTLGSVMNSTYQCVGCGANTVQSGDECRCKSFYERVDAYSCKEPVCLNGHFVPATGCECDDGFAKNANGQCIRTCENGQWNGTQCQCNKHYELATLYSCKPINCVNGAYNENMNGGSCVCTPPYEKDPATGKCTVSTCPPFSTYNVAIGKCVCNANYAMSSANLCVACGANTVWNAGTGRCDCKPFYSKFDDYSCTAPACSGGRFDPINGCQCPPDFFWNDATKACTRVCVNGFWTATGCQCNAHFEPDSQYSCKPFNCVNGVYQEAVNGCVCTPPYEKDPATGKCNVSTCPPFSTYNAATNQCVCNTNYVKNSANQCVPCGLNTFWSAGSCVCNPHYVQVDQLTCAAPPCTGGNFDPASGCTCTDGFYWNEVTKACTRTCVHGTWTGAACQCDQNYEFDSLYTCKPVNCVNGIYNPTTAKCECFASHTEDASGKCTVPRCTAVLTAWDPATSSCICVANYVKNNLGACVPCGALTSWTAGFCACTNNFYTRIDALSCAVPACTGGVFNSTIGCDCPAGWDYDRIRDVCTPRCLNGAWDGSRCVCSSGFEYDTLYACKPIVCVNGVYNSATARCDCYASHTLDQFGKCTVPRCTAAFTTWDPTTSTCVCVANYVKNGLGACVPCGLNTAWSAGTCVCTNSFYNQVDALTCAVPACTSGRFDPNSGCVCPAGSDYDKTRDACIPKCTNSVWNGINCACSPGFEPDTQFACKPFNCVNGVFNFNTNKCDCSPAFTWDEQGRCTKNRCPRNATYDGVRDTCVCPTGFVYVITSNSCVASTCPVGQIMDANGNCKFCDDAMMEALDGITCKCRSYFVTLPDGRCVQQPTCQAGYVYNPTSTKCELVLPNQAESNP